MNNVLVSHRVKIEREKDEKKLPVQNVQSVAQSRQRRIYKGTVGDFRSHVQFSTEKYLLFNRLKKKALVNEYNEKLHPP